MKVNSISAVELWCRLTKVSQLALLLSYWAHHFLWVLKPDS